MASQGLTSADSGKPTGAGTPADALGESKRMTELEVEGQESDVECPTCGRKDFASRQGMKVHHSKSHGESIAGETVECVGCGDKFKAPQYRIEQFEKNYCSEACRSSRVDVECAVCGVAFEIHPSQEQNAERHFCTSSCQREWLSQQTGENNNTWKSEHHTCDACGDDLWLSPSRVDKHNFCGLSCYGDWLEANACGEANPNWNGGGAVYYGRSWTRQRERALERDNHACQSCGMSQEEHERRYSEGLNVHHITPFSEYGCTEHRQANRLENLVSLCVRCHSDWEGIPLRPEVAE